MAGPIDDARAALREERARLQNRLGCLDRALDALDALEGGPVAPARPLANPLRQRATGGGQPSHAEQTVRIAVRPEGKVAAKRREDCATVLRTVQSGPKTLRDVVRDSGLSLGRARRALDELVKQRVIERSGTGPWSRQYALRVAPSAGKPAGPKLDVVFSGRDSLIGDRPQRSA